MRRPLSWYEDAVVGWAGPRISLPRVDPYYDGLEQGLLDSFKREAQTAAAGFANMAGVSVVAYLRSKGRQSCCSSLRGRRLDLAGKLTSPSGMG